MHNLLVPKREEASLKLLFTILLVATTVSCARGNLNSAASTNGVTSNSSQSLSGGGVVPAPQAAAPQLAAPQTPVSTSSPISIAVSIVNPEPLIWETSSHPERAQWSANLIQIVDTYFSDLDPAVDIGLFCPGYPNLSRDEKILVWADLFAADAYYESGWDPANASVDVGTANNKNTWSVGLLQVSVVDQQSYGFNFGFTYADLQTPTKNLELGVAIMAHQIQKHGKVLIPVGGSGLYWSTLHPGGKYDQTAGIEKKTKKLSFCH